MGFLAYVCTNREDDAGVPYADKFINISILDTNELIDIIKRDKIKSVVTAASDLATLSQGIINDRLNLSGILEKQVKYVTDKKHFIELQKELNISHPKTYFITSNDQLEGFINLIKFPSIMKPFFSSGSRGVRVVKNFEEIKKYHYEVCNSSSLEKGYLLQEFLTGWTEYGCECMIEDGEIIFLELTRKFLNERNVPIGHFVPCEIDNYFKDKIIDDVKKIIKLLEIKNSPINMDILMKEGEHPVIIDLSFRLGGNCLPQIMDLKFNLEPFERIINHSLSVKNSKLPKPNNGCYGSIVLGGNSDGVLTEKMFLEIKNIIDKAEKTIEFVLDIPVGGKFKKMAQGNHRFGHVILKTKNQEQYKHLLNEIYSII
jgi:hypothetical protein